MRQTSTVFRNNYITIQQGPSINFPVERDETAAARVTQTLIIPNLLSASRSAFISPSSLFVLDLHSFLQSLFCYPQSLLPFDSLRDISSNQLSLTIPICDFIPLHHAVQVYSRPGLCGPCQHRFRYPDSCLCHLYYWVRYQ